MIRKAFGEFVATCNDCGCEVYGGVQDDFHAFVRHLIDDEDWRAKKPESPLTLERLLDDYDWRQAFAEPEDDEPACNVVDKCDPCPPDSDVDLTPPKRSDVKRIVAADDGENDEDNWLGVFELNDGRFLLVDSGCDYTGWD